MLGISSNSEGTEVGPGAVVEGSLEAEVVAVVAEVEEDILAIVGRPAMCFNFFFGGISFIVFRFFSLFCFLKLLVLFNIILWSISFFSISNVLISNYLTSNFILRINVTINVAKYRCVLLTLGG